MGPQKSVCICSSVAVVFFFGDGSLACFPRNTVHKLRRFNSYVFVFRSPNACLWSVERRLHPGFPNVYAKCADSSPYNSVRQPLIVHSESATGTDLHAWLPQPLHPSQAKLDNCSFQTPRLRFLWSTYQPKMRFISNQERWDHRTGHDRLDSNAMQKIIIVPIPWISAFFSFVS